MKSNPTYNSNQQKSIKDLYQELLDLKDYRPSKKVNLLFTKLVQYVLNSENKSGLGKEEVFKLQTICQLAI